MATKTHRRRCPVCRQIHLMRTRQITCSTQCAAKYRAAKEDKAWRREVMRKAGRIGAAARRARIIASLEDRCAKLSKAEAWLWGYRVGYSAGWYRGVYDRPSHISRLKIVRSAEPPLLQTDRPADARQPESQGGGSP